VTASVAKDAMEACFTEENVLLREFA